MDVQVLRSMLAYCPKSGQFTWLVDRTRGVRAGDAAGSINSRGYVYISVFGKKYKAHRLAWFWMTGMWPSSDIDHKNGCRADNRWGNLRPATRAQNARNRGVPKNNKTGFRGVFFNKATGHFVASVKHNGRRVYFGTRHDTPAKAAKAYDDGIVSLHAEFARPNLGSSVGGAA